MPSAVPHDLPVPSADEMARSDALAALIRQAMAEQGGTIGFDRYMQLALYAPGLGYYSAGQQKLGAAGDFVTAPELSPLFSRCLARQVAEALQQVAGGAVLEFGAGTGTMAADMLLELERLECLPERYLILEVSADLRQRQRATLNARVPHLQSRAAWLEELPQDFTGVVVANELLDAMPVHRVCLDGRQVQELGVTWRDDAFQWTTLAQPQARVTAYLQAAELGPLPPGYTSEVNLAAADWVQGAGQWLKRGLLLLIDYGFPRHEFYHPQRATGTLMCHYRHRAQPDPLILPGLQDITAHVDFTAVAEAAVAGGLDVVGFANQANFLLGCGLLALAEAAEEQGARLAQSAQLQRLLMPGEMGELFKVLALGRGVTGPWCGFSLRDERYRL